jgi:glutaconate CoA-transferase subunit A
MTEEDKHDKQMDMSAAIDEYVDDGDTVFIQWQPFAPMAAINEIIRQGKEDLTITCASMTMGGDLLLGSGAVSEVITGYFGLELLGISQRFRRAVEDGVPNDIEVEEYSNFNIQMMNLGGALGFPYVPMWNLNGTDYMDPDVDTPRLEKVEDPFSGKEVAALETFNPDVALVHTQRSDAKGNVQVWGSGIEFGLYASDTVIASVEEVVDTEVVRRDPDRTVVPNHRVNAVVEEPWGAHPENIYGYYDIDWLAKQNMADAFQTEDGFEQYLEEWVYGVEDRSEYIQQYIERMGYERLQKLIPGTKRSAPNYGNYELEVLGE